MKYKDKVVVITGAAQGIGKALSLSYVKAGAQVVLIDKNEEALRRAAGIIKEEERKVHTFAIDLVNTRDIENVFSTISNSIGRVDILINNAGLGITKPIEELSIDEWDYVINTNLRGAFVCSKEACSMMKKNGGGTIINIASTRSLMSEANTFAYSASKGGILSLTHSLAVSLGADKIRVNAISPGWIETGDYNALSETDHSQHPAGRVGNPEDIVKACFYLTDPDNDFVTGTNLVIDGGMTTKMIYAD